jgi:hypothetical protein
VAAGLGPPREDPETIDSATDGPTG